MDEAPFETAQALGQEPSTVHQDVDMSQKSWRLFAADGIGRRSASRTKKIYRDRSCQEHITEFLKNII